MPRGKKMDAYHTMKERESLTKENTKLRIELNASEEKNKKLEIKVSELSKKIIVLEELIASGLLS